MCITKHQNSTKYSDKKPLVSFCLLAYNQEKYIKDAVMGAFAQTYSPLEIIISDDCSTDGTYDVLKTLVTAYRGPHRVKLFKNPKNIGICSHVNLMWQHAGGEWIFAAAGDDVSSAERVEKVMNLVIHHPKLKLVLSYLNLINDQGNIKGINRLGGKLTSQGTPSFSTWDINDRIANKAPESHGACFCYSRELIDLFDPLPVGGVHEDNIINWRAELTGDSGILREPLVSYRVHQFQITHTGVTKDLQSFDNKRIKLIRDGLLTTGQNIKDYNRAKKFIKNGSESDNRILHWLNRREKYCTSRLRSIMDPWPQRLLQLMIILLMRDEFGTPSLDNFLRSFLPNYVYFTLKKFKRIN